MSDGKYAAWIRNELVTLWHNMIRETRLNLAPRGSDKWSLAMDGIGERIRSATKLVGPVNWRDIPVTHIFNGWFEHVNQRLGIDFLIPTDTELTELRERYTEDGVLRR